MVEASGLKKKNMEMENTVEASGLKKKKEKMEMGNMVEASGLHAETKGKWNVGGRTLPVIACYVHNLPTIQ